MKYFFSVALILLGITSLMSQLSLSDIQEMGIRSEADLKKMGFSDSEILSIKSQYLNGNNKSNDSESNDEELSHEIEEDKVEVKVAQPEVKTTKSFIYGHDVFTNGSISIKENNDRIKAPGNYLIGTGDVVSVVIWGSSEFSGSFTVDDYGNITPRLVGRINLKGKRFDQAKKIIQSSFARVYDLNNSEISIELSYSKIINVNVVGEVNMPGTYTVPSINSAFNVLALAGGVSELGTLREIKIIRASGDIVNLDVYEFMMNPEAFGSEYLTDGDFIVVSTAKNIVTVKGVKRAMKYELSSGESLADLLNYSGGVMANHDNRFAHVKRKTSEGEEIIDVDFSQFDSYKMNDGDEVEFYQLVDELVNLVTIEGAVLSPGSYEFKEGETIGDFVKRSGGARKGSHLQVAYVFRKIDGGGREIKRISIEKMMTDSAWSGITISEGDVVHIIDHNDLYTEKEVKVTGEVKNPKKYTFYENMKLSDLIILSGGVTAQVDLSKVEIERINFEAEGGDYVQVISVNVSSGEDYILEPFDIVNLRALPEFTFHEGVKIIGEVKYPGYYSLSSSSEYLLDIVERAGGLTEEAYLQGGYIQRRKDSIGLVVIKFEDLLKSESSKYNYNLKPGDVIYVPEKTNTVTIEGQIGFNNVDGEASRISCPVHNNKRAKYYVKRYGGGYTRNAKRSETYVVKYNGMVAKSKMFGLISPKVGDGDVIKVKEKEKAKKVEREDIDWNRTIESFSVKLSGIVTLWVLINQIGN